MKFKSYVVAAAVVLSLGAMGVEGASTGKRSTTTITALSNDANGIFEDQTGTAITLNGALVSGGIARAAASQQVSLESSGNISGVTFLITGTDADGRYQAEVLTGPNADTVKTVLYFLTVDSVTPSGSVGTNVEGGWLSTNGAVSQTLVPDLASYTALMSIVVDSCTCTYTVEHTSYNKPSSVDGIWFDTVAMVSKTADAEGNIVAAVGGVRAKITAYTSGELSIMILQASNR
jgi:hypothetical protein